MKHILAALCALAILGSSAHAGDPSPLSWGSNSASPSSGDMQFRLNRAVTVWSGEHGMIGLPPIVNNSSSTTLNVGNMNTINSSNSTVSVGQTSTIGSQTGSSSATISQNRIDGDQIILKK